ncbi:sugar phosphate isomerase/epimerase [Candidatus Pacearchaeota archaeon]|nr:sugar phosphate isomerase/epimerase [Candidatus Pacearchaeota archaeon]
MKIGFMNHPRKNILKEIEWIGKNRFDFVDLYLEEDSAVPDKINLNKVKKLIKKYDLEVVGHTAWYLPIGSPSKILREAAIKEILRYLRIFKKLGVKYVTIHANWPPTMFSDKEGIRWQIETLKKICLKAKKYGIKIMLELIDTERDTLKNISLILNGVQGLYFHLDVGHANLFKKKITDFIKKFHKKIRHVHLHDNHGEKDEHFPIGKGDINFKKVINELRKYYNGTITLEIFSENKKLILNSKKKLRKLWERK